MAKTLPQSAQKAHIERLFRGASVTIPERGAIEEALKNPKGSLRVKFGIDPTTPDYHFGYFVIFRKLRILQDLGHQIILLIGGYTARFGDPTDKLDTRTFRDKKQLKGAVRAFREQAGLVLDLKRTEIRDNSDWYDKMNAEDLLRLMSDVTVAQMLEREMFRQRQKQGKPIGLHELVYPLLQGHDSVEIESDITIIGQDQLFNENIARPLQERAGQRPQMIIGLELIPGTDGSIKMSQSLGNAILLTDAPKEQFGKLMSLSDGAALQYGKMLTDLNIAKQGKAFTQGGTAARDAKLLIAEDIVAQLHGTINAETARKEFKSQFEGGEAPSEIEKKKVASGTPLATALKIIGARDSMSAAKRVIEQKGVKVDGEIVTDPMFVTKPGMHIQVGKRKHTKLEE